MHVPMWLFWLTVFGTVFGLIQLIYGRRPYVRPIKVTTARRPTGKHHAGNLPEPPPGWHRDPDDPTRSYHEPRSGVGVNSVTFVGSPGGAVGQPHLGGGGGGKGAALFSDLFKYQAANRDDAVDAPPLPAERSWAEITDQTQVLPLSEETTGRLAMPPVPLR